MRIQVLDPQVNKKISLIFLLTISVKFAIMATIEV